MQWYDSYSMWYKQCISEWSVECECVCMRLDERMVSAFNDCDCVARVRATHVFRATRVENWPVLSWPCGVYTTITVCVKERRHERKRRHELKLGNFILQAGRERERLAAPALYANCSRSKWSKTYGVSRLHTSLSKHLTTPEVRATRRKLHVCCCFCF